MNMDAVNNLIKERKVNTKNNKLREELLGVRNFFPGIKEEKQEEKPKFLSPKPFDWKNVLLTPKINNIKNIHYDYKMSNIEIINPIPERDIRYIYMKIKLKALDTLEYIGSGSNGHVYAYKNYVIKKINNGRDIHFLKKIQHIDLFPKLYFCYNNDYMVYEKIEGKTLNAFEDETVRKYLLIKDIDFKKYMYDINSKVYKSLECGVVVSDLIRSNIMITKNGDLKIVDCGHFYDLSYGKKEKERDTERAIRQMNNAILNLFNIDYIKYETL